MYAPTSFAVAVSKTKKVTENYRLCRRTNAGHDHYQDRRHLEGKGKGSSHILQILGVGLGGKRLYHLTLSHFIPKYIRSDTKDTQQDPTSTFYFPRLHRGGGRGFVNTSRGPVSSGNRTDCREVYFFFFVPPGWYITGMTEAFVRAALCDVQTS